MGAANCNARPAAAMIALYRAVPPTLRGVGLIIAVTFVVIVMHTLIRRLATELHPFEIAFFRTFFGLPVLIPWFMRYGVGVLRTNRLPLYFVRAVINTAAMLMFFTALTLSPLATVNAMGFTAPLFAALIAMAFLGEASTFHRWRALVLGFAGAMVILRPGLVTLETGVVLALISSAMWGFVLGLIKILSRTDTPVTIAAYMVLLMSPLTLIPALFVWQWPTWGQLGWLLVIGMSGTLSHMGLAQALREADAAVVMPFDFFKLIWAALLGFWLFGELPDAFTWLGGIMIFTGATYVAARDRGRAAAIEH